MTIHLNHLKALISRRDRLIEVRTKLRTPFHTKISVLVDGEEVDAPCNLSGSVFTKRWLDDAVSIRIAALDEALGKYGIDTGDVPASRV